MTPTPASYPAHRAADVALRSGASIRLRPLCPDDERALLAFLVGLSDESRGFRFFSGAADLGAAAHRATDVDYADRYGVVAVTGDGHTILAHGMYARDGATSGEVAFAVADRLQGERIATTMLAHLAEAARSVGIERFWAEVLPQNHRMVDLFRDSGFTVTVRAKPHALIMTMPTELDADARRRYDERDAVAAAAAVASVLRPRALAVVGASARPGSVGGAILRHVLAAGFTGDVHAIGTRGGQLEGLVLHRSVRDVPGDLDLAVVAVPADAVLDVARDCAAEGVRALVVVSAGFAEAGARGRERQRELMRICRAAGMRLVGPNCLGVMNTDPAVGLNASLGPVQAPPGRVAFMSQSGALGIAVIGAAKERGLGLSSFVSVGNKADLSSTDFLAFWDRDEGTDVILLYLESFGNPRRFSRVARGVAARKPIVVVKGGRASGGARAGCSHTRALLAASDATVDALFAQSGVVRTDTLGELLDVAGLLAAQAPPAGPRVGIVTNGSGLGILCADACQAGVERGAHADLRPARVARGPTRRSRRRQPARPARGGLARAVRARNRRCRRQRRGGRNRRPLRAVARHGHRGGCGRRTRCRRRCTDPRGRRLRAGGGAPGHPGAALLPLPEDAARALGRAARYGAWRAAPTGRVPALEVDDAAAAAIIARALGRGPGWFATEEAAALLHCYGIAQPRDELVADADAAGATAHRWRRPIALKGVADGLVHRSDARAVAHGLSGARTPLNPRCGPPDEPVIGGGAHALAARARLAIAGRLTSQRQGRPYG